MHQYHLLHRAHPRCVPDRFRQHTGKEIAILAIITTLLLTRNQRLQLIRLQPRRRLHRRIATPLDFPPNFGVCDPFQNTSHPLLATFITDIIR